MQHRPDGSGYGGAWHVGTDPCVCPQRWPPPYERTAGLSITMKDKPFSPKKLEFRN